LQNATTSGKPVIMKVNYDNGHFTEVTKEAGIHSSLISFGLGVAVSDINNDGWPDIYTTSDYTEKDCYYINNHNGTFTDITKGSGLDIDIYGIGAGEGCPTDQAERVAEVGGARGSAAFAAAAQPAECMAEAADNLETRQARPAAVAWAAVSIRTPGPPGILKAWIGLGIVAFWVLFAVTRTVNPYVQFDTPGNEKTQQAFGWVLKALLGVVALAGLTKLLLF